VKNWIEIKSERGGNHKLSTVRGIGATPILTRRARGSIKIGDEITITIFDMRSGRAHGAESALAIFSEQLDARSQASTQLPAQSSGPMGKA